MCSVQVNKFVVICYTGKENQDTKDTSFPPKYTISFRQEDETFYCLLPFLFVLYFLL